MVVSKFRQVMKYLAGFSFQFLVVSHFERTSKKMKVTFSLLQTLHRRIYCDKIDSWCGSSEDISEYVNPSKNSLREV